MLLFLRNSLSQKKKVFLRELMELLKDMIKKHFFLVFLCKSNNFCSKDGFEFGSRRRKSAGEREREEKEIIFSMLFPIFSQNKKSLKPCIN
jgi:hypothetical protein